MRCVLWYACFNNNYSQIFNTLKNYFQFSVHVKLEMLPYNAI